MAFGQNKFHIAIFQRSMILSVRVTSLCLSRRYSHNLLLSQNVSLQWRTHSWACPQSLCSLVATSPSQISAHCLTPCLPPREAYIYILLSFSVFFSFVFFSFQFLTLNTTTSSLTLTVCYCSKALQIQAFRPQVRIL